MFIDNKMYWDKRDKNFLQKIYQNSFSRKTDNFRRNLHINGIETDVSVIKVKTRFLEKFGGYNELPDKRTYQIYNKRKFNTAFFRCDIDIIVTDYHGQIIEVQKNVVANRILSFPKATRFLYVMKPNLINYLKIDIAHDRVGTK